MMQYLCMLKKHWCRHVCIGVALFIAVLTGTYAIQSPVYRVEGAIEMGRTPILRNGHDLGFDVIMPSATTKELLMHLPLPPVIDAAGRDMKVHVGVRAVSDERLLMRASAASPESALKAYGEMLQALMQQHAKIYQERFAYWTKVQERMMLNAVSNRKLVERLNGCVDLRADAKPTCLALLASAVKSLDSDAPMITTLGEYLLPDTSFNTRQLGELVVTQGPVSPDWRISFLLALYSSLLVVASYNLLLCRMREHG